MFAAILVALPSSLLLVPPLHSPTESEGRATRGPQVNPLLARGPPPHRRPRGEAPRTGPSCRRTLSSHTTLGGGGGEGTHVRKRQCGPKHFFIGKDIGVHPAGPGSPVVVSVNLPPSSPPGSGSGLRLVVGTCENGQIYTEVVAPPSEAV